MSKGKLDVRFAMVMSPKMAAALERAATRRMMSQSALVRIAIAKEIGLYPLLSGNETPVAELDHEQRQLVEAAT